MIRQSSSRNHRSKGIKIKYVLQICLLVAVCFWLIYQVKHSHDKRKEFSEIENGAKISEKAQSVDETLKLGRKDLHPRVEEKSSNSEKHEEEELDDEETGDGGVEENKHDVVEKEEEAESKNEEKEDEERGGGDDEIDELDQDKIEGEADHEEDFVDEEKEREEESEEKDTIENDHQIENESTLEDQDHDGSGRNTHEAREEHYKADDASSEVAHDTNTIATEIEKISSGHTIEDADFNILEEDRKSNETKDINDEKHSDSKVGGGGQMTENIPLLNVTAGEEKDNKTILLQSEDSSLLNSTISTVSNDQPELNNNMTKTGIETPVAAVQNDTETILDSTQAQNATVDGLIMGEGTSVQTKLMEHANSSNFADDSNHSDSNSTISSKMEDEDTTTGGHQNSSNSTEHAFSEIILTSNATAEASDGSEPLITNEADATQNENSNSSYETGTTDETEDAVQNNPDDSSDSISQDERENQIDLDTLPEIRTEGSDNEDAAAE